MRCVDEPPPAVPAENAVRLLSAGDAAVLMEFPDTRHVGSVAAELRSSPPPGLVDLLPAERTILAVARPGTDLAALRRALAAVAAAATTQTAPAAGDPAPPRQVTVPVRYDGPDLADVARLTGRSEQDLIALHCTTVWRCEFIGFAPGFSYLASDDANLDVPRRREPRTSVPAGSVAIVGRYTAVYPRSSPGGWQLIGSTDVPMWDLSAQPPALVQPGMVVRFVEVDRR